MCQWPKKALISPSITFPISYFGWRAKKKGSMHARKKRLNDLDLSRIASQFTRFISLWFEYYTLAAKASFLSLKLKFSDKADIDHSKRLYIFWKWKGIEWETNFCTMKYGPQKLSNIGLYSYYIGWTYRAKIGYLIIRKRKEK